MNIKSWFAVIMMGIITLGFGLQMYFQYAPIHIIDLHTPLKILTPIVHPGSTMVYLADYCLYKQYPATVARTLVDHTLILLPLAHSVGTLGCHKIEVQVPIPEGALSGTYHMEGIVTYTVTPTRSVEVPFNSEAFKIQ